MITCDNCLDETFNEVRYWESGRKKMYLDEGCFLLKLDQQQKGRDAQDWNKDFQRMISKSLEKKHD